MATATLPEAAPDPGETARVEGVLGRISTAWAGHRNFATWLVSRLRAETIVDLGVDFGFSTFCFALPGLGHVYGVDAFEGDEHAGFRNTYHDVLRNREELGLDNLTIIRGRFADVAKGWTKDIDILHIDGRHTYEAVSEDFGSWKSFVKPSGVVLFHDTCVERFGVRRLFDELPGPKLNFANSHGLGVVSRDAGLIREISRAFADLIEAGSARAETPAVPMPDSNRL